jgi:hypothetical protein
MNRPDKKISDFAKSPEFRDQNFAAKAAVDAMAPVPEALYAEARMKIASAVTWLVEHETHRDAASFRNMKHAIIGMTTAWGMIRAYSKASGEPVPKALEEQYEFLFNYFSYFEFHDHS